MAADPRIERVLVKLGRVREKNIETFGAGTHRYQLAPPLTEAAVLALETTLRLELPADYRAFLLTAGSAGAGPYYGLLPPERWDDLSIGDGVWPDVVARPCPWRAGLARDDATWEAAATGLDEPFQGAIALADQGCGSYVALVVTGEARGRVMYVSLVDEQVPFFPDNRDFLDWYERWLDELLLGFKHSWFGMSMPGTEATFAAAAEHPDGQRRLAALHAMHQLPSVELATRAVIAARIADPEPAVRAAALGLVKAHRFVAAVESTVRAALDDEDARVRGSALDALIRKQGAWQDAARRALADVDPDNVSLAAGALERAGALRETDVLALLGSPSLVVRKAGYWAARELRSPRVFDQLLALSHVSDDEHALALQPLLAQLDGEELDASRRTALLDRLLERIATIDGPDVPRGEIHALRWCLGVDARAFATLVELTRHPEPFARFTAAAALGDIGSADALPALRALLDDTIVPRGPRSSARFSVGESARRAIAKIENAIAKRS